MGAALFPSSILTFQKFRTFVDNALSGAMRFAAVWQCTRCLKPPDPLVPMGEVRSACINGVSTCHINCFRGQLHTR